MQITSEFEPTHMLYLFCPREEQREALLEKLMREQHILSLSRDCNWQVYPQETVINMIQVGIDTGTASKLRAAVGYLLRVATLYDLFVDFCFQAEVKPYRQDVHRVRYKLQSCRANEEGFIIVD